MVYLQAYLLVGFILCEIEVLDRMLTGVRVRRRIVVADALLDKP